MPTRFPHVASTALLVLCLVGPAAIAGSPVPQVAAAHRAYADAIAATDLPAFLAAVTDDVVLTGPGTTLTGKSEVAVWAAEVFATIDARWQKTPLETVVAAPWAFERYAYRVEMTPVTGGVSATETGHGVNIYRLGADGGWRVARDIWTAGPPARAAFRPSCAEGLAPC